MHRRVSLLAMTLAVQGGWAIWIDEPGGAIWKIPVTGGTATKIATDQAGNNRRMVVDATNVYFTNFDLGVVRQVPIAGGSIVTLVAALKETQGIASDAKYIYWSDSSPLGGVVARVPIGGGTIEGIATSQVGPTAVAVDAARAYWTNMVGGTIASAPLAGGTVTTLASGQVQPVDIAVDAVAVYWVAETGGTVVRVAK